MEQKLTRKTKLAYGMTGVGDAAFYCIIGTFALFYLTTVAGIKPATAGTIVAIGSVWNTIACAVIGHISDNFSSKYGKRKPFIVAAAFPLAIFTVMIFTAVDAGMTFKCIYYAVALIIFWTSYSAYYVPFTAWGAELTRDYNERTVLRGIVYAFYNGGAALGMLLPTIIVDILMDMGKSQAAGWQWAAVICGSLASLAILIGAFNIKVTEEETEQKEKKEKKSFGSTLGGAKEIVKSYAELFKMKSARCLILGAIFYLIGSALMGADRMYYYTYKLDLSPAMISFVMAFQLIISTVLVPVIVKISNRTDKRVTSIGGFAVTIAVMVIYGIFGIPDKWHMIFFSGVFGIGSICYWQLVPAMMYDVCDADLLMNRKERAGTLISFQSLAESLSEAVGLQLLGIILGIAGFVGDAAEQSAQALIGIHFCMTFLPAAFILLAMIMIIRYPITKKMYLNIRHAIERRDAGEEVDLTEFKKLK